MERQCPKELVTRIFDKLAEFGCGIELGQALDMQSKWQKQHLTVCIVFLSPLFSCTTFSTLLNSSFWSVGFLLVFIVVSLPCYNLLIPGFFRHHTRGGAITVILNSFGLR
jgi:hypothetical protein